MTSGNALDVLTLETILLQFLLKTGFVRDPINKKHPVEMVHLVLDTA
jgi:hypothetical protein